jgi:dTDP-L-rhamnose 4-epimerase
VSFEDGLGELTDWVRQQTAEDRMEQAMLELKQRGLVS